MAQAKEIPGPAPIQVNVLDPVWQAKMLNAGNTAEVVHPDAFSDEWVWKGRPGALLYIGYPFCRVWPSEIKDSEGKTMGTLPEGLIVDLPFSLVRIGRDDSKHCLIYVQRSAYGLPEGKVEEWNPPPDATPPVPEMMGTVPEDTAPEEVSSTWMGGTH